MVLEPFDQQIRREELGALIDFIDAAKCQESACKN